jgi:hypothetical protein
MGQFSLHFCTIFFLAPVTHLKLFFSCYLNWQMYWLKKLNTEIQVTPQTWTRNLTFFFGISRFTSRHYWAARISSSYFPLLISSFSRDDFCYCLLSIFSFVEQMHFGNRSSLVWTSFSSSSNSKHVYCNIVFCRYLRLIGELCKGLCVWGGTAWWSQRDNYTHRIYSWAFI